jgi:hypothetical protein
MQCVANALKQTIKLLVMIKNTYFIGVGLTIIHFQNHLSSGFQEFPPHDAIKVFRRKIPLDVSKNVINYLFRS